MQFTNYSTGGTGDDINTYFVNGQVATPLENGSIVFPTHGTYQVTLGTTDASGEVANDSIGIIVTVTPPLEIMLYPSTSLISAGQNVTFTNSTSGGTGGTTFNYTVVCRNSDNEAVEGGYIISGNKITFTAGGTTCTATIYVKDASGETNQTNVSVTVTPVLKVTSFSATTPISIDQYAIFTNVTTGGTGSNHVLILAG